MRADALLSARACVWGYERDRQGFAVMEGDRLSGKRCVNSAVVCGGPSVTDSITETPHLPGEGLPAHA